MDDGNQPGSGHNSRRNSHYDEQRASRSSLHSRNNSLSLSHASHSRANSRDRLSEYNISAGPSTSTAHHPLPPLHFAPFEASSRHDVAAAEDHRREKHHGNNSKTGRPRRPSKQSGRSRQRSASDQRSVGPTAVDEYTLPSDYDNLDDAAAPPPVIRGGAQRRLWQSDSLENELGHAGRGRPSSAFEHEQDLTELSALPPTIPRSRDRSAKSRSSRPSRHGREGPMDSGSSSSEKPHARPPTSAKQRRASRLATQLFTLSYLVLFSILGTLARLGLQWLTFYPGAPVIFSEVWANVAGSLVMGFLAEDRNLFREEWGTPAPFPAIRARSSRSRGDEESLAKAFSEAKAAHGRVKKTIPLYIGLATGFCGSFTSFSSFMRDIFLALSNDMPAPINHPYPPDTPRPSYSNTLSRNGGYSFMAVVAVIAITTALCMGAYMFGAHVALALDPLTPTIPFRLTRRIFDIAVVPIAWCLWLGAVFMTIWPPDRPSGPLAHPDGWAAETWRGQVLFAVVFAPLGCLLRFYGSLKLNGMVPSFPLGTFAVNVFGTAVLGMAYDLQHVRLDTAGGMGGGRLGCQALEGVMDGFCGSLTTVSTWIAELKGLRLKHSYVYGVASVAAGLGVLVAVMGSVKWTIGFGHTACATTRWA